MKRKSKNQETNQSPVLFMALVRTPSFLVNIVALVVGAVES